VSRTDVHRPWRVQQTDWHERHRWYRFQSWPTEPPELIPTYRTHNCVTCNDTTWARQERRRDRHRARRDLRNGKAI
jgi:hypothetical protein